MGFFLPLMQTSASMAWIAIGVFAVFLLIFFHYVSFGLWIFAKTAGVNVSLIQLLLMRLRRVDPDVIVRAMVTAHKAGLKGISNNELEAHYLAGGNVVNVVNALVEAKKERVELSFQEAVKIDVAGHDVVEAVRKGVNPLTEKRFAKIEF